ncbi:MAG TPA: lactonase family protein [Bacillaceae bacterium]
MAVRVRKGREALARYIGYVGTYTRESSEGIYSFVLDSDAGKLGEVKTAAKVGSPTYLAIDQDRRHLYSVAQVEKSGGVSAYSMDADTGELTFINGEAQEGAPPCHLDVRGGKLVTGNYHEGTVELYNINRDGGVDPLLYVYKHDGDGPHKRQEKPHVHYTANTPDGRFIVVADLGTDELVTYKVENDSLVKVNILNVNPGSGPRHLVFHPNGKQAYLLTELSSEVVVLDYNPENGSFIDKQYILAKPKDFSGTNDASAIHISSDGRFVYTGNRGHNSIAVFRADEETGELELVEFTATGGEWPRDFALDPSEAYIVAANQHTGNLVLFARDRESGKLTRLDSEIQVPEAVCVKFLRQ